MRRAGSMSSTTDLPLGPIATRPSKPRGLTTRLRRRAGATGAVAGSVVVIVLLTRHFLRSSCPPATLDVFASLAARPHSTLTTLVLVAGHAIYRGQHWTPEALRDERNWILEPFQTAQVGAFLSHIQRGVELAANDSTSLLVFSGGQTRPTAGPRSEATTYWLAADSFNWWGHAEVEKRAVAEEYARDSFENVLFAICRFKQLTGRYPLRIRVISFEFKRRRFVDVHRAALRYPEDQFEFVGVDPPGAGDARKGELLNSRGPFEDDPHGCTKEVLRTKKVQRNPYIRYFGYPQGCEEIAPLFRHCGHHIYDGKLPWVDVDK